MKQEETSSHEAEDDREVVCDDVIGERHDEWQEVGKINNLKMNA